MTRGYKIVWKDANGTYRIDDSNVGSGDPSTAIQAAVDELLDANGGAVYVADGKHFLGGPITVKSGVELSTGVNATLFDRMGGRLDRPLVRFEPKSGTGRLLVDA